MTIGKKLMASSVAMLGLTVILSVSSLRTTGSLGTELSKTASVTARQMELAGAAAADAANMLSAERGMLLRLALGDQASATTLNASFASDAQSVSREIDQIRSLVTTDDSRAANDRMSNALQAWLPAHEQLWQLCSKQDYQTAFKVFDQKVAPQARQMQQAANQVVAVAHSSLEEEKTRASTLPAESRWIAVILLVISVATGAFGVWIVRGATRNLREMAINMSGTAAEVIDASQQISSLSEQLARGASDQAASLEETSASSTEISSMTQRCSEAARDTGELITAAVSTSNEGSTKLNDMVAAISAITESAAQVREMVVSVNAASQEQARGIGQISEGLSRMEKVTQQTAASAHEGRNASHRMLSQARALEQVVEELKTMVDDTNASAGPMSRMEQPAFA